MIAFREFSATAFGRPEGIDSALVQANEWLLRTGVQPLNIETLRNITGGGMASLHIAEAGLRVWYRVGQDGAPVRHPLEQEF